MMRRIFDSFLLAGLVLASSSCSLGAQDQASATTEDRGPKKSSTPTDPGVSTDVSAPADDGQGKNPLASLDLGLSPEDSKAVLWWENLQASTKQLLLGALPKETADRLTNLSLDAVKRSVSNLERAERAVVNALEGGSKGPAPGKVTPNFNINDAVNQAGGSTNYGDHHDRQAEHDNYAHALKAPDNEKPAGAVEAKELDY